ADGGERAAPERVRGALQEAPQGFASGRPHRVPVMGQPPDNKRPLPLAVSMGDPAGIGLEIALKAWAERRDAGIGAFLLFADPEATAERARMLGLAVPILPVATAAAALDAFATGLPVRPIQCPVRPRPGEPDAVNAAAVIEAIEEATAAVVHKEAAAV